MIRSRTLSACVERAADVISRGAHPRQSKGYLHFTFLVWDGEIQKIGMNSNAQSLAVDIKDYQGLHSEIAATRNLRGVLSELRTGFDAVNIRMNRRCQLRMSKPCACCHKWLKSLGCRYVAYSTRAGFLQTRV